MREPVDHILRPLLPWRSRVGAVTECGLDASKVKTITRDDFARRRKELGLTRAAMMTCVTCSDTSQRWCSWDDDPRGALGREIEWERGRWGWNAEKRGETLKYELQAVAALIESHREEFDALIAETAQRREWLKKKESFERERAGRAKSDRRTL